jgi:integrase
MSLVLAASHNQPEHLFGALPETLDGSTGTQRGLPTTNSLGAQNDLEAILVWLSTKAKNSHTRRAYLLEIKRFLAFMVWIRGRAISSATDGDLEAFRVWLGTPQLPESGWPANFVPFKSLEMPPGSGRWVLQGLAVGSRQRADSTVKGLFKYLHEGGYLAVNPYLRLGKLTGEEVSLDVLKMLNLTPEAHTSQRRQEAIARDNARADKAFSVDLWKWLTNFLDAPENDWRIPDLGDTGPQQDSSPLPRWPLERQERLRCILLFGYASAGRRAELAETTMNAIVRSGNRWVWKVVGKGRKAVDTPDRVTMNDAAMQALLRYRIARGLSAYPDSSEKDVPLIAKLTPKRLRKDRQLKTGLGVTADHLNKELQRYFQYAASFAGKVNPAWEAHLLGAASHALRHTRGTHFALANIPIATTADQLRHKDPRTTANYYVHIKDEERAQSVDAVDRHLAG